jgi:elongation factor 1-beta
VKVFEAINSQPDPEKYPWAAAWYKKIKSHESEFASLPGDPTKPYTAYGPDISESTISTMVSNKEVKEDDDNIDLFGSDEDEEEDAEAARTREKRLAEYNEKKAGRVKPAAKSMVTMDVKPWGT